MERSGRPVRRQGGLILLLNWSPLVHLASRAFEAWVSPQAGGRLCRVVWHGPRGDRDLVVPVQPGSDLDADHWPKQGAFPMLPYTNRMANARFNWHGEERLVRSAPGQIHGLHGMGHRRSWDVLDSGASHVSMCWRHHAIEYVAGGEWPWSFTAEMSYRVDEFGLHFSLALRNDSAVVAPAILGWHPYVHRHWLAAAQARGSGIALHALGSHGLRFPNPACGTHARRPVAIDLQVPHTLALESWSSSWKLSKPDGEELRIDSDAMHLVHHVPPALDYVCVEPVTSLPGRLHLADAADQIGLEPGHWRRLNCKLQAA